MKSTLIVVAHQDDESLSCGGLILLRKSQGFKVSVLSVFGRKYNYGQGEQYVQEQNEAFRVACTMLGVDDFDCQALEEGEPGNVGYYEPLYCIEQAIKLVKPTEIVIPGAQDRNQDHMHLHDVCVIATRPWNIPHTQQVLCWLSPDGSNKAPNYFVPMTTEMWALKLAAVECYARESRTGNHPRSPEKLAAWHRLWGSQCNEEWAEPYVFNYGRDQSCEYVSRAEQDSSAPT